VDRQQPDHVGVLLLGHCLELLRPGLALLADEADEALDVGAAQLLVRARQARELAQVRVAAASIPLREHGEVVVVRGDDFLAEPLERESPRGGDEPLEALAEGLEEAGVARIEPFRKRSLEALEERPPGGVRAQQHKCVVRDADQRRCEHGDERLVVVAVVQ
jgi:hypothetical protein